MIKIIENYSLKKLNTFGIEAKTHFFIQPTSLAEISELIYNPVFKENRKLVIGGGSNILFTKDFDGIVVNPIIHGVELIDEDDHFVFIRAGAGEEWDSFVDYTVKKGWGGLENLSLIPGTCGAAPIQNIGAYGVEAKDTISFVEYIAIENGSKQVIQNKDCKFEYRSSIFKKELKGKAIITHVTFKLSKNPVFVMNYGNVMHEIEKFDSVNLYNIRKAIISIRKRKLPDPAEWGNAGSFFKNPIISSEQLEEIKISCPDIPFYESINDMYKIPAAYLIERCGWKGAKMGNAGVHENQPLVLINLGNATSSEIIQLSKAIIDSVNNEFSIILEPEVNFV